MGLLVLRRAHHYRTEAASFSCRRPCHASWTSPYPVFALASDCVKPGCAMQKHVPRCDAANPTPPLTRSSRAPTVRMSRSLREDHR